MTRSPSRNDQCPCGSGKKFKRCHGDSESRGLDRDSFYETIERSFKGGPCLYPGPEAKCTKKAIRSHTIPKQRSLRKISSAGHVLSVAHRRYDADETELFAVKKLGLANASTFSGFCQKHDGAMFSPIETQPLLPSAEQAALLAYRALSREFYLRRGLIGSLLAMEAPISGAQQDPELAVLRVHFERIKKSAQRGLRDYNTAQDAFEQMLKSKDFTDIRYAIVETKLTPDVMCSTFVQPDVDYAGKHINEPGVLSDRTGPSTFIGFNIFATEKGGAIAFSWADPNPAALGLVKSFLALDDESLTAAAIRFAFEYSENTFFRESWWGGLPEESRSSLLERFEYTAVPENMRKTDALLDDGLDLGDWGPHTRHELLN